MLEEILQQSLRAIASQINFPTPPHPEAQPIVVFNPLSWKRSEVVAISLPILGQQLTIYNSEGNHQLPSQLSNASTLLFLATDIPAIGYSIFWAVCQDQAMPNKGNSTSNFTKSIPSDDSYSDEKN